MSSFWRKIFRLRSCATLVLQDGSRVVIRGPAAEAFRITCSHVPVVSGGSSSSSPATSLHLSSGVKSGQCAPPD